MEFLIKLLLIVFAAKVVDLALLAAEERGWIYYRHSRGRSGSAASAFLEIQSMMEPSRKHAIEVRQEKEEDDEAGDPPNLDSERGVVRASRPPLGGGHSRTAHWEAGGTPAPPIGPWLDSRNFHGIMDEVLQQYTTPVQSPGGTFNARAIAVERDDGTWEGYIEFVPTNGGKPLRTDRETSQPNRDAVAYWASGIEPVYLAGALERASRKT